jgi:hypothetical protein
MKIYTESKVEQYDLDKGRIYKAYNHHHHGEIDHVQIHELHHVVVDLLLKHQDDLFVFQ